MSRLSEEDPKPGFCLSGGRAKGLQPISKLCNTCYGRWSFETPVLGFVFYHPFSIVQNNGGSATMS
eukprot:5887459-Prorocentrum_lima.AAC.1